MEVTHLFHYASMALYLTLIISMPTLLAASVIGIVFALIQALTQLQEQTFAFTIKLLTSCIALALTLRWMGAQILTYTESILDLVAVVGR